MKKIALQAHKGVERECPENTMASFRRACELGYDVIELDLRYTRDRRIVVLHDLLLNRTARNADGSPLPEPLRIDSLSYEEACRYDFGLFFSEAFRGERLPLFSEVLSFAAARGIRLKIDNRIREFPEDMLEVFFREAAPYAGSLSVTAKESEFVEKCLRVCPALSFDYDGEVNEETLKALRRLLPRERLTVWLPYPCKQTAWVTTPFITPALCRLVKRYASLGIWLITEEEDLRAVRERYAPDIVETDGGIRPLPDAARAEEI